MSGRGKFRKRIEKIASYIIAFLIGYILGVAYGVNWVITTGTKYASVNINFTKDAILECARKSVVHLICTYI
ncbi:MAG: hypothetical protein ACTSR1_01065 [Candidatus Heimdallarchaeota archaeon]